MPSTSLFPTTLSENPHAHTPRLPHIRTGREDEMYSPGPLGATPRFGSNGFQTPTSLARTESYGSLPDYRGFSPVAYRPQTPRTHFDTDDRIDPRDQPPMNPVALSHRVARNSHFEKSKRGGLSGWYHKKMAERENKKFRKTYV